MAESTTPRTDALNAIVALTRESAELLLRRVRGDDTEVTGVSTTRMEYARFVLEHAAPLIAELGKISSTGSGRPKYP